MKPNTHYVQALLGALKTPDLPRTIDSMAMVSALTVPKSILNPRIDAERCTKVWTQRNCKILSYGHYRHP